MNKLFLLTALFLVCFNVVASAGSTTLVVTKKRIWDSAKYRFDYKIAATLDIQGETSQKIGEMKASKQGQEHRYFNYQNKAKTFGIYISMQNNDVTYTSHGRSQYIQKPVKLIGCNDGKTFCNATTYYGYL